MPQKQDRKQQFFIDSRTQKGKFADGVMIRSKGNLFVIDFGFHTPEGIVSIVSRVIVQQAFLKALHSYLGEVLSDSKNDKKTKNQTK